MKFEINNATIRVTVVHFISTVTEWAVYTDERTIHGTIHGDHIHLAAAIALQTLRTIDR